MKNEIKEILNYLKDDKWNYYSCDGVPYKVFLIEKRDKLLDYITNLEEENKKLNNIINETKENINTDIYLLKTGVKRNFKHISITEAISILEMILIQINN